MLRLQPIQFKMASTVRFKSESLQENGIPTDLQAIIQEVAKQCASYQQTTAFPTTEGAVICHAPGLPAQSLIISALQPGQDHHLAVQLSPDLEHAGQYRLARALLVPKEDPHPHYNGLIKGQEIENLTPNQWELVGRILTEVAQNNLL